MKVAETRQKILDAALALVSEKGYLGSTTRAIARGAGVTELTLFRHFGSKERLFEELLGKYTFLPALKGLLPLVESLSLEEALHTIGERFLLSLKERKPMVKIMYSEFTLNAEKVRKVYNGFIVETWKTLAVYFESLQKKGLLRNDISPELAARAYLGMLFSYFRGEEIVRGVDITKQGRMQTALDTFVAIFTHGAVIKTGGGRRRRL